MEIPAPKRSKWPRVAIIVLLLPILYVFSYAPYLDCVEDSDSPYYRSPKFFRGAEWIAVKTYDSSILRRWSEAFGVSQTMDLQLFYFVQGEEDPSFRWHFNIQSP